MSDYKSDNEVRPRLDCKEIRKMALLLLDNFDGVPFKAYEYLSHLLKKTNNRDILDNVDVYKDKKRHCAYIGEDYAEEELAKLEGICEWHLDGQGYSTECGMSDMIYRKGFCDCGKEVNIVEVDDDTPIIDDMSVNDMKSFIEQEAEIYKDV